MTPLHIAQVNDIAAVGGTLARAMTALGEDAVLIEPRRVGTGLRYPWKAVTLPFRGAALLGAALRVRRGGFDLAHVHYARFGFMGPLTGRPDVIHVHGTDIRGIRPGSLWARETAPFLRRAALVYYATPDLAEWVLPFRPDARFLPNPIETASFRPLAAGDPARPNRRDLLVGVRLSPIKGLDEIVETLRLLAVRRPQTSITVVAQGEGLEQARLAAGPNAVVVARTSRDELPDLLRGHRLALGQFAVGAIGNYELEALSCGVPVVMRFDRGEAYATPPPIANAANAAAAAERICELLDDAAELDGLAALGPPWIDANHAALTVAARVLADYRSAGLG